MKKLKSKGIRLGTLIEIALLIAILLLMLLPGGVVITPIGIPSVDSGVVLASPATERQSPDAILAITNLTPNDVTYIQDDPDSPDGNWLVAIGVLVNTDVRVSFPTPSGNPTVGADLQEFRALVRQFDEAQTGTPTARIELWENGTLIRAGAETDVPKGGIVLSFTWNANEIGTADGSLVECMVVGTKIGGPAGARNTVDVGAVEWNVDYTLTADISNTPNNYAFGIVSEGSTSATGLTHFEVTNNSGFVVNITVGGTDMTGGATWTLSDNATPGTDMYGLKAGLAGDNYTVIVRKSPYNILVSNLADNSSQQWGLQLLAPTSFSDGGSKSGTVTLTATQA